MEDRGGLHCRVYTIYIEPLRPVKINWYVSRCSESFLENAPDARWGVALADRHCLESPSFIRPTCRMLDAYQFMPHLRIPRVGGASFSLPFSPPFSYSRRLVDVRRGISFRYHVCSYDSRCNVPATQVNRFCRFSEWKYFFEEVKFCIISRKLFSISNPLNQSPPIVNCTKFLLDFLLILKIYNRMDVTVCTDKNCKKSYTRYNIQFLFHPILSPPRSRSSKSYTPSSYTPSHATCTFLYTASLAPLRIKSSLGSEIARFHPRERRRPSRVTRGQSRN